MIKKLNKLFLCLFLISIFFFKIPNFYIIPFFKSAFFTSQAMARILLVLVSIFQPINYFLLEKPAIFNKKLRPLINLILLFFFLQSLTVFVVINQAAFLNRYKDVLISLMAFFTFFFYKKYLRQIILVLLLSLIVNFFYQSLIILFPGFFVKYFSSFIYQKHVEFVIAKLQDSKIYTDTYDEIILPLLFVFPFGKSLIKNLSFYVLFTTISVFSFLSNIRTRVLMLVIGFVGSFSVFKKRSFKKIFMITLSIFVIGFLINNIMRYYLGYSFVDRLVLGAKNNNTETVKFRIDQIKDSLEMGKFSLLGVGLGGYYDNLMTFKKNNFTVDKFELIAQRGAKEFVHNILGTTLVESGYIGLIVFIGILAIFIKNDLVMLESGSDYQKAFIVVFWSLFSYGLFNPIVPAAYQVLFWGIRGLLT